MITKNFFIVLLSLGIIAGFSGCRDKCNDSCIEEKRCSGPLSDRDVCWDEDDYK